MSHIIKASVLIIPFEDRILIALRPSAHAYPNLLPHFPEKTPKTLIEFVVLNPRVLESFCSTVYVDYLYCRTVAAS